MVVYLDLDHRIGHVSFVYTGLLLLAARNRIRLRFAGIRDCPWGSPGPGSDLCVYLDVRAKADVLPVFVCIDVRDRSGVVCEGALADADLYFRRCFYQPDVDLLPSGRREKVRPFGLNFPSGTAAIALPLLRVGLRDWRIPRWPRLAALLRNYLSLPTPDQWEWDPVRPKDSLILFQTRVWELAEARGEDVEALNEARAAVVRALRHAFGDRFVGGLIPTPLARRRYPELVTNVQTDTAAYSALSKRCLIGIYTRGLHYSTAWKMAEYMASSLCIVAEPVRDTLPDPLVAGTHYLPFQSADECVQACARVLGNPTLQLHLRRAAFDYYLTRAHPASAMLACLRDAVEAVAALPVVLPADETALVEH